MAKGRMLKKEISSSKKLGALESDSARLLYTWLIPWLDIEGRYTADPDLLKGHIFPKVKTMTINKIKKLLIELAQDKLIYYYKFGGETYLQFYKFKKMQSLNPDREAKSEIPPFNHKSCELLITPELSPQVKLREVKLREVNISEYTPEFLEFYSHYPKQVGQRVAFDAWRQHPKKNHKDLIEASKNYNTLCKWRKEDPHYIKDPSGFIRKSKEYWKDYINITIPKQVGESKKDPNAMPDKMWRKLAEYLYQDQGLMEKEVSKFYSKVFRAYPMIKDKITNQTRIPEVFKIIDKFKEK